MVGLAGDVSVTVKILRTKVCLVGEEGVGKTSLVRRFVLNAFDDHYIHTIGTKVSKKTVDVLRPDGNPVSVEMLVWDIMGNHNIRALLRDAYFGGVHGALAVADLTRRDTLEEVVGWTEEIERVAGDTPLVLAMNKADLTADAQVRAEDVASVARRLDAEYRFTSAKTGENVEAAFGRLGDLIATDRLEA